MEAAAIILSCNLIPEAEMYRLVDRVLGEEVSWRVKIRFLMSVKGCEDASVMGFLEEKCRLNGVGAYLFVGKGCEVELKIWILKVGEYFVR